MDNKAQGALEYLLLIGGAVLVAAVVIVVLSGMATTQAGTINEAEAQSLAAQLELQATTACLPGYDACEAWCTDTDYSGYPDLVREDTGACLARESP